MLNKKIAMSALSIVTVVALVGGATFALYTDQATANDSTFASGNADLRLALGTLGTEPAAGAFEETVAAPDFSGLYPGYSSNTGIWLKNTSTSPISLDLIADIADLNTGTVGSDSINQLKDSLLVKWTCDTDDNNVLNETSTAEFSVNAWFLGGEAPLGTLAAGNAIYCQMSARVATTAGNEIQGDAVTFDAVYNAEQNDDVTPSTVTQP